MAAAESVAARVAAPPRLVIGGPADAHDAAAAAVQVPALGRELLRSVLQALIEEGRRFSSTAEGQQIASNLVGSRLHKDGKVLWTMGAVDEFLDESGSMPEAPLLAASLLEAVRQGAIEDYLMLFLEEHADRLYGRAAHGGPEPAGIR
ncbi:MAG TPA: hypothetical protein VFZ18_02440 [Longimicrobiaceae bacterium]